MAGHLIRVNFIILTILGGEHKLRHFSKPSHKDTMVTLKIETAGFRNYHESFKS
jgi:hypothetical protein